MIPKGIQGFTLIEVVLAIAVGLIIIAGVSVGYTYAKRAAIQDNQRKSVAAIKTFVEQAIAAQQADMAGGGTFNCVGGVRICPPRISPEQFGQLALRLPSLMNDPYTGNPRFSGNPLAANGCPGSCFTTTGVADADGIVGAPDVEISTGKLDDIFGPWGSAGSGVVYIWGETYRVLIRIKLADGTTKVFIGYAILESDQDGNVVAAEGGDRVLAQLAGQ